MKPLRDVLIIKRVEPETTTESGIIIPTGSQEKPQQGEVVAVGTGRYESGLKVMPEVQVGDRVIFKQYSGKEIKVNGESVLFINEEDVLAVI